MICFGAIFVICCRTGTHKMHHKLPLSCVALSQFYQGPFSFTKPKIWEIDPQNKLLFFQHQTVIIITQAPEKPWTFESRQGHKWWSFHLCSQAKTQLGKSDKGCYALWSFKEKKVREGASGIVWLEQTSL